MSTPPEDLHEAARMWAIRVADPAFEDWDGFTDWLAGDPARAVEYDRAADAREDVDTLFESRDAPVLPAAQPRPDRRRILWLGGGGAIAAALAVTLGIDMLRDDSAPYTVETPRGVHRTVALADGSRIDLNGDTRLVLDRAAPRLASLERGEAMFHVRHDAADPFVVRIGKDRLVDAGTAFNVARDAETTRVQVSQGKVIYNPDVDKLALDAGATLTVHGRQVTLGRTPPRDIGGWRTGTLVYAGARLDTVAADLSRSLGRPVAVAPAIASQPFTGTLAVSDGEPGATIERIAPLLGVVPEAKGDGWTLTSPNRARP